MNMQRRRWLQFSLRFLFAALLAAACVAWWFRPGIVKPEFSLERFSRDIDEYSGKEIVRAFFRVTNAGPDSIRLNHESDYHWTTERKIRSKSELDADGWETVGGSGGFSLSSHNSPIQLRPGEHKLFAVTLSDDDRTIKLGVDIADRRGHREKRYWSQFFTIPEDVVASSPH